MKNDLISKGKHLSFLLRHDTSYKFDKHGWREIKDLVDNHGYTMSELEEIVATNDKKRYEFSLDKKKIRALQGHSIQVDVELKEIVPPDVLYHGTATRFLEQILKTGIKKMSRLYVQLSGNIKTAEEVGARHGTPVILEIDTKKMTEDGIKFFFSKNEVWLVDYIDPKYIKTIKYNE